MQIDSGDARNAADADALELTDVDDAPEYAEVIAMGYIGEDVGDNDDADYYSINVKEERQYTLRSR